MAKSGSGLGAKAAGTIYPLFIGNALGVLLAAFKIVIATRLLGAALFGVYVFIVSYYTLIGSVTDFGIYHNQYRLSGQIFKYGLKRKKRADLSTLF